MSDIEIDVTAAVNGKAVVIGSTDEKLYPVGTILERPATLTGAGIYTAPGEGVSRRVAFFVPGKPVPKGDHTVRQTKGGFPVIRDRNATKAVPWRALAVLAARSALAERPIFDCAVRVAATVLRIRPRCHFFSGKRADVMRPDAPAYPEMSPDLDKVSRALGDALEGVLWTNDSRITTWRICRRWGSEAGIMVIVEPEPQPRAEGAP